MLDVDAPLVVGFADGLFTRDEITTIKGEKTLAELVLDKSQRRPEVYIYHMIQQFVHSSFRSDHQRKCLTLEKYFSTSKLGLTNVCTFLCEIYLQDHSKPEYCTKR